MKKAALYGIPSVVVLLPYTALHFHCKRLRKQAANEILINQKKDQTRPSNQYYGLNWGFRTDETIERSLDTGSILFFNYNCFNLFYPKDVLKCLWRGTFNAQTTMHDKLTDTAVCFRTPNKLLVIYNEFDKVEIRKYSEFLNKPYIKAVRARTMDKPPYNLNALSVTFVDELRSQLQTSKTKSLLQKQGLNLKTKDIVGEYLRYAKVLKDQDLQIGPRQLDMRNPLIFHSNFSLSESLTIRTDYSKNMPRKVQSH